MSTTDRLLRNLPSFVSSASSPEDITELCLVLAEEARLLARQEVELARAELQASGRHATGAGAGFAVAALVGFLALAVLSVAASLALAEVVPASVAFLLVGVVLAGGAAVAYRIGRQHLDAFSPVPSRAIHNIKEDLTWLRTQVS
ncbi:MAG TPA: phage holin family protein [Acidimicrobiales bacterium]|nr:phage holin family protein [Acidimicrobiales bacterium]